MYRVCLVFLSVYCSHVVTCWKRADLLALLYAMFYCVIVTFPCGVLVQIWCLIASIPDLCLLSYFELYHRALRDAIMSLDDAIVSVERQKCRWVYHNA